MVKEVYYVSKKNCIVHRLNTIYMYIILILVTNRKQLIQTHDINFVYYSEIPCCLRISIK